MACYHPLKRWVIGYDGRKQQEIAKITSYNIKSVTNMRGYPVYNYQEIPCGKCIACRAEYTAQWATRCILEAKKYEHNEMLTLTYNEEHLPMSVGINTKTGEYGPMPTLVKKDVQDFLKRLRKKYQNIRYYMCGEYGEQFGRPHYHLIVFNINVEDKENGHINKKGNMQQTSKSIEKIWGKGLISLEPVNYETCAYVARYIMKKLKGPDAKEIYQDRGQVPEYTAMSTRPGIACDYFNERGELIYETQEIFLQTQKKIQKVNIPRYFDKLLEKQNPEKLEEIKERRKALKQEREYTLLKQANMTREQYLKQLEYQMTKKQSKKVRQLETST